MPGGKKGKRTPNERRWRGGYSPGERKKAERDILNHWVGVLIENITTQPHKGGVLKKMSNYGRWPEKCQARSNP